MKRSFVKKTLCLMLSVLTAFAMMPVYQGTAFADAAVYRVYMETATYDDDYEIIPQKSISASFTSLGAALAQASGTDECVITLLDDINEAAPININHGNLTIKTNGHDIKAPSAGTAVFNITGDDTSLTIDGDSNLDFDGIITAAADSRGTLVLKGGKYTASGKYVINTDSSYINIACYNAEIGSNDKAIYGENIYEILLSGCNIGAVLATASEIDADGTSFRTSAADKCLDVNSNQVSLDRCSLISGNAVCAKLVLEDYMSAESSYFQGSVDIDFSDTTYRTGYLESCSFISSGTALTINGGSFDFKGCTIESSDTGLEVSDSQIEMDTCAVTGDKYAIKVLDNATVQVAQDDYQAQSTFKSSSGTAVLVSPTSAPAANKTTSTFSLRNGIITGGDYACYVTGGLLRLIDSSYTSDSYLTVDGTIYLKQTDPAQTSAVYLLGGDYKASSGKAGAFIDETTVCTPTIMLGANKMLGTVTSVNATGFVSYQGGLYTNNLSSYCSGGFQCTATTASDTDQYGTYGYKVSLRDASSPVKIDVVYGYGEQEMTDTYYYKDVASVIKEKLQAYVDAFYVKSEYFGLTIKKIKISSTDPTSASLMINDGFQLEVASGTNINVTAAPGYVLQTVSTDESTTYSAKSNQIGSITIREADNKITDEQDVFASFTNIVQLTDNTIVNTLKKSKDTLISNYYVDQGTAAYYLWDGYKTGSMPTADDTSKIVSAITGYLQIDAGMTNGEAILEISPKYNITVSWSSATDSKVATLTQWDQNMDLSNVKDAVVKVAIPEVLAASCTDNKIYIKQSFDYCNDPIYQYETAVFKDVDNNYYATFTNTHGFAVTDNGWFSFLHNTYLTLSTSGAGFYVNRNGENIYYDFVQNALSDATDGEDVIIYMTENAGKVDDYFRDIHLSEAKSFYIDNSRATDTEINVYIYDEDLALTVTRDQSNPYLTHYEIKSKTQPVVNNGGGYTVDSLVDNSVKVTNEAGKTADSTIVTAVKSANEEAVVTVNNQAGKLVTDKEITLDLSNSGSKINQITLSKDTCDNLINSGAETITIGLNCGDVKLYKETLDVINQEAQGANVTLQLKTAVLSSDESAKSGESTKSDESAESLLNDAQSDTVKAMDKPVIISVVILANGKEIHEFGGNSVILTIPCEIADDSVVIPSYISEDGNKESISDFEIISSSKDSKESDAQYMEIECNHFSTYVIESIKITDFVQSVKFKATSKYTANKNIKVTAKTDNVSQAVIKELKDRGFTVKYKFLRSRSRNKGYALMKTLDKANYTNTYGRYGRRYYYRAKMFIYDEAGNFVAGTTVKDSTTAYRIWKK